MLGGLPVLSDDRVLIDFRAADDGGVYQWAGGPALVQTVDFFTPIVDDPYEGARQLGNNTAVPGSPGA